MSFDASGHATTTIIGPFERAKGASVAIGSDVLVLVNGAHVIVRRACDDAVIFDEPNARPPGDAKGSAASVRPSQKYLLLSGADRAATFRIE